MSKYASQEQTEHTESNLITWLEKQDAKTTADFMSKAQAHLKSKRDEELSRLKREFESTCAFNGVSLAQVYMHGRNKAGRKAKSKTARIIEDDNASS